MKIRLKYVQLLKCLLFYFVAASYGQYYFVNYLYWGALKLIGHAYLGFDKYLVAVNKVGYNHLVGDVGRGLWVLLIVWLFIKFVDKTPLNKSFLNPSYKFVTFVRGLVLGAVLVVLECLLLIITNSVTLNFHLVLTTSVLFMLFVFLLMNAFTVIAEEFVLRGYILSNLIKHFNPHFCIITLSILFGCWHLQYSIMYGFMATFMGLLLGYAYYLSKNIYYPLGIHFGWNFIEFVIYSPQVSHLQILNPMLSGVKNINPGDEGLISLAVIFLGCIWLGFVYYRRNKEDSNQGR